MCMVGHWLHKRVFLILVQRNEAFFKKKQGNPKCSIAAGAAQKDSFFRLPEWFLWFSAALSLFKNNIVVCVVIATRH